METGECVCAFTKIFQPCLLFQFFSKHHGYSCVIYAQVVLFCCNLHAFLWSWWCEWPANRSTWGFRTQSPGRARAASSAARVSSELLLGSICWPNLSGGSVKGNPNSFNPASFSSCSMVHWCKIWVAACETKLLGTTFGDCWWIMHITTEQRQVQRGSGRILAWVASCRKQVTVFPDQSHNPQEGLPPCNVLDTAAACSSDKNLNNSLFWQRSCCTFGKSIGCTRGILHPIDVAWKKINFCNISAAVSPQLHRTSRPDKPIQDIFIYIYIYK